MNDKKNQHQVSDCLLREWVNRNEPVPKIHYYDILNQTTKFEKGAKTRFAIVEHIYTSISENGDLNYKMEDDFSVLESDLGRLIKAVKNNKPIASRDVLQKAIKACISLGYRNSYYAARIVMELSRLGKNTVNERIRVMNNTLKDRYNLMSNWEFGVVYNINETLLVNEQPFRDWTNHKGCEEFVTMALGPRAFLFGRPSRSGLFNFGWLDARTATNSPVQVKAYNEFTIGTARQFVVASTKEEIDEISPRLSKDLVQARMATDRVVARQL